MPYPPAARAPRARGDARRHGNAGRPRRRRRIAHERGAADRNGTVRAV